MGHRPAPPPHGGNFAGRVPPPIPGRQKLWRPGKSQSYTTSSDDFSFGRGILAGSRDTIPVLAKSGVTLSEITAAALSSRLDAVGYHEGRIADLERRRRSLREDYERLKAKRKPPEDIEDAVEVL